MGTVFIHTADWQIGKPFSSVEDNEKRSALRDERIQAIRRIAQAINESKAEFVVVAGDLFDSPSPTNKTVSATCSAIGSLKVPVYVIPGNHDHGGPGSIWGQGFFLRERDALSPNLHVLLNSEPLILDNAILFPCPLLRKHEPADLTSWLRDLDLTHFSADKTRIVIAHGSVLDFIGVRDEDEADELISTNFIDIARIPHDHFDYMALGDWHGTKQINEKAWYSGTHEPDRFYKGIDYNPGNVLIVNCDRSQIPGVKYFPTAGINWLEREYHISDDNMLETIKNECLSLFESRVNKDLLKLNLTGSLGLDSQKSLDQLLEALEARLIRVKISNHVEIAPTDTELEQLLNNQSNPLITAVANQLFNKIKMNLEDAEVARVALKELYFSLKEINVQ